MKFFYSIILLFLLNFPALAQEQTIQCKVVAINDGDTITCLRNKTQIKARLVDIDAPELSQPYGNKAKQMLSKLIYKKDVTLVNMGYDKYQRVLAIVYDNGKNINLELVRAGMAWAYNHNSPIEYQQSEQQAKKAKIGLWQSHNRIHPSEWRKQHKQTVNQITNVKKPANCPNYKLYCSKLNSYEQAVFYYKQCGQKHLDGNNDGIPCNKLYREFQQNRK